MGVRVSGDGYRSYRAAHDAGNQALDKLLNDLSKEGGTTRQAAAAVVCAIDRVHGLPALKASRTFRQVGPDLVHQACCAAAAPD